jgi:hypothetical protein
MTPSLRDLRGAMARNEAIQHVTPDCFTAFAMTSSLRDLSRQIHNSKFVIQNFSVLLPCPRKTIYTSTSKKNITFAAILYEIFKNNQSKIEWTGF